MDNREQQSDVTRIVVTSLRIKQHYSGNLSTPSFAKEITYLLLTIYPKKRVIFDRYDIFH